METRTKAKEKVFVLDGKSKNKDSVKRKMKLLMRDEVNQKR